jgi:hypothetical protein
MASPRRASARRRLLTAGVGVVAFTAVEGLACGNPMEPPHVLKSNEAIETPPVEAGSAVEAATPSATDASRSTVSATSASASAVLPASSKASPPKR